METREADVNGIEPRPDEASAAGAGAPRMGYAEVMRWRHRLILGDDLIAHIKAVAAAAPPPPPEVVDTLRRIFTRPAGEIPRG